ncbi:MAG TPA: hypothetical protein VH105_24730, partial [Burkholderiales bacterium]|nr:hypothetical protein [Burkholderiales bacterium]
MTATQIAAAAGGEGRTRAFLPPRILAGFILAVFSVLLIALFSYRALQSNTESAQKVTHTGEVIAQFEVLLSMLKDAETGQ